MLPLYTIYNIKHTYITEPTHHPKKETESQRPEKYVLNLLPSPENHYYWQARVGG